MLIDAILFNGEWDILELRIAELEGVVSKFVVVESAEYHGSGNRKEPRVYGYQYPGVDIHYVWLDHLEPAFDGTNSWARENYHRNKIMESILEVSRPEDIVMLSDCDEIPRAQAVLDSLPGFGNHLLGTCQDFFYYNVNTYGGEWHGTVIGMRAAFEAFGGLQAARNARDGLTQIANCGWHFSYFGGIDRIREKTRNFAHAHEDICKILDSRSDAEVLADIRAGRDLYHRDMSFVHRDSDDYRLPKYFLENQERFASWMT